ncbi:DUF6491 family protein [Lysobacter sp. A286]
MANISTNQLFLPAVLGMLLATPSFGSERIAPAGNCLDTRLVNEVFQADERTLAVAASDGLRYRLSFADACGDVTTASDAKMLAKDGWMCGTGNEFIAMNDRLCPVDSVARISAAEYAEHARASHTSPDGTVTLSTVKVQGERRRGFAASSNYCINPRYIRGWSEDPEGVVVEMDPRRSGGNRFYRVELTGSCPQLSGGSAMSMRSGMGIGLVCGNPGDTIQAGTRAFAGGRPPDFLMTGSDRLQILGAKFGCPVRSVYPMDAH